MRESWDFENVYFGKEILDFPVLPIKFRVKHTALQGLPNRPFHLFYV